MISRRLPCAQVLALRYFFLGAHGNYYGMVEKFAQLKKDPKTNPFVDPEGYRAYVENREKAFREIEQRQKQSR